VIDDPDGYTNIRSGPSVEDQVITRVIDGEVFCVLSRTGNWWLVRTAHDVTGYMYYDRIRIIGSGVH
jgi:uncharacterized protein YgiM (DUF1202 family)